MAREKTLARKEHQEAPLVEPWDTFGDMERMFREFFASPLPWLRPPRWMREISHEFAPEVDLKETEKEYILSATIPGIDKEGLDIDVMPDRITIAGERKHEEEKPENRYHVRQQTYGSFRVSYALPTEVKPKEVKAHYKNGVLEVEMPKAVEAEVTHKVPIED
jgi:HSP20 family protein